MLRLNIGCGHAIEAGAVNLDIALLPGVDVVGDAERPLPFSDQSFDEIGCTDVLEHVTDVVATLREIHRVTKPGGSVVIRSPHFTSREVWEDPTHRRGFAVRTFDFFCRAGHHRERAYYCDFKFDRIESVHICFHRTPQLPWNYLIEPLVNRSPRMQSFYELTFLARLFPAGNVAVVLKR